MYDAETERERERHIGIILALPHTLFITTTHIPKSTQDSSESRVLLWRVNAVYGGKSAPMRWEWAGSRWVVVAGSHHIIWARCSR